jgi:sulfoxide reductase heme-binding subunit YedZ
MRATGIVALALLSTTMVLGILTAGRVKTRAWPGFAQAELHKRISLLAMVFVTIHVLTAVLDTYVHVGVLAVVVPFSSPYRPLWTGLGTAAVDLMLALAVSGALRQRIRARTWRAIHWLAYGSWPVAMAHSLGMGTDATTLWMDGLVGICAVTVVGSLVWRVSRSTRAVRSVPPCGAGTRLRTRSVLPSPALSAARAPRMTLATNHERAQEWETHSSRRSAVPTLERTQS